ncbi:MAG: dihydroorotate dehydrogenase electron transfer subunit [Firmicutes bacterium]|nr:dihydroorotate dehydrogenase electron transfer subunit [Bacillota bacterium]
MLATESAAVVSNEQLNEHTWLMRVQVPAIAQRVKPGQFVQVRVTGTYDPFLRTPLSVHDCDPTQGTIDLLYQTVGTSTRLLSEYTKSTPLNILGPLGRGFTLPAPASNNFALLVAGGIGIAPMLLLARKLVANQISTRLLYGARSVSELVRIDAFERLGVTVACSTDDGSYGITGNVVDLLAGFLQSGVAGEIFACGPNPMLRALQALVREKKLSAQLSLEAYMACGLGACLGCAVPVPGGGYKHVCTDGPVFDEREVQL